MYYREGSKDAEMNKLIQEVVGAYPDGIFGPNTTKMVKAWQKKNGLKDDGIVGPMTLEVMGILDTDLTDQYYTTESGLKIQRYFLPRGEYIDKGTPIKNEYGFFHHTAGWDNPYAVIDQWGRDSRGKVATENVLGGQRITDERSKYDGVMLQAFPDGCQGWHLGKTGSYHMNTHSVALEMCSFGWLKDGKTYVGTKAHPNQICTLDKPFRGFTQWHKYSNAQIEGLRKWILFIAERDNIDVHVGIIKWLKDKGPEFAFEFHQDAYEGKVKGLMTHTNVRKDKWDNFPQPELCDMLMDI